MTTPESRVDRVLDGAGREIGVVARHVPAAVRPKLRGWLHLGAAPVALVLGLVLMALCDDEALRWGLAAYIVTTVLLFGMSAVYHVITWRPGVRAVLRRIDHANIFLFIAGSYTPLAIALLPASQRTQLLVLIWAFALLGVAFQVVWIGAPRWLSLATYLGMGWVAIFYAVPIWRYGGVAVAVLLILGGLCYSLGAVVYGRKRPDPDPTWFGYHEVFHALTIVAYTLQYAALAIVVV